MLDDPTDQVPVRPRITMCYDRSRRPE
jgi:hypothetical protein